MSSHDSLPDKISHTHVVYIIVGSVGIFLSTLAVILRFISRLLTFSIKWDDWACLGALIFAYACLITVILDATIGHGGYDARLYSMSMLEMLIQVREPHRLSDSKDHMNPFSLQMFKFPISLHIPRGR